MSYGYSVRIISLNKKADRGAVGVRLGRVCIKHDISVSEVAIKLKVSRQTVYNWFTGFSNPKGKKIDVIHRFLDTLKH